MWAMADNDIPRGVGAVSWGPDRIDLFTVDEDAGLVHRVFVSGTWQAPTPLGGTLASTSPALVSRSPRGSRSLRAWSAGRD